MPLLLVAMPLLLKSEDLGANIAGGSRAKTCSLSDR